MIVLRHTFCALLLSLPLLTVTGCDNMSETQTQPHLLNDNSVNLAVSEALERETWFSQSNIEVTSLDGQVTLNGTVASMQDKNRATEVVTKVNGVKDVNNELEIINPADAN